MIKLFPGIYRLLPDKLTPTKYCSFLVETDAGNLLFPCFSSSSTFTDQWDELDNKGGVRWQLLGDTHFATQHNDAVAKRFNAPLLCSDVEATAVGAKVKRLETFPFEEHDLAAGVTAIPTPGHREGAVSYLVKRGRRSYLFAGDTIWHDGKQWTCYPSKKGRSDLAASLRHLADISFQVLLANTHASNETCYATVAARDRARFLSAVGETAGLT